MDRRSHISHNAPGGCAAALRGDRPVQPRGGGRAGLSGRGKCEICDRGACLRACVRASARFIAPPVDGKTHVSVVCAPPHTQPCVSASAARPPEEVAALIGFRSSFARRPMTARRRRVSLSGKDSGKGLRLRDVRDSRLLDLQLTAKHSDKSIGSETL